jgi:hypothetical protein
MSLLPDPSVSPADTIRRFLALPSPASPDELAAWIEAKESAAITFDVLLAVGERDKAEIERVRDAFIQSDAAAHYLRKRVNASNGMDDAAREALTAHLALLAEWLEDGQTARTWKQRTFSERRKAAVERERDRRKIARLTEALKEARGYVEWCEVEWSTEAAEEARNVLAQVAAVLADEGDAANG